jgi:uncharacterized protein (DUF362 family)
VDKVYLSRCESYDPAQVESSLRRAVEALGVVAPSAGSRVFVKPNCAFAHPKYAPASYTHPTLIRATAHLLKGASIVLGENGIVGFPSRLAMEQAGYMRLARDENLSVLPLDEARFVSVPLTRGTLKKQVALPQALQDSTFLVSLPKLKANAYLPFSGALENHLGLLQHETVRQSHDRVTDRIVDLLEVVKPNLIAVDAIEMGDGMSSVVTAPRPLGALIVGTNALAVDVVCAAILGLNPREVPPIRLAAERGYSPADLSTVDLSGDISLDELRTKAAGHVQVDPRPEKRGLPEKIKIVAGVPYSLAGTAGALGEFISFMERGGIEWKEARATTLVIGKSAEKQVAPNDTAAIVFLGDKSYAPYQGFSRIVRLRGEPVLTVEMLDNLPFAMKLRNPLDDFRGALWKAKLQSAFNAWRR